MTNFLTETIENLKEYKYNPETDVNWIGTDDGKYSIDWLTFKEIANLEYDSGYGAAEIAKDLVIVMNDGCWFDRGEYDGSEWWNYNKSPQKKPYSKKFDKLCVNQNPDVSCGWENLERINHFKKNE